MGYHYFRIIGRISVLIIVLHFNTGIKLHAQINESILLENFEKFIKEHPEERIYIHTDRDIYAPGSEIQFKAYISNRNGAASVSDSLYILLLNYQGDVKYSGSFPVNQDNGIGEINLNSEIETGEYTLKAYTDQALKSSMPALYSRKIMIKNLWIPPLRIELSNLKPEYSPGDLADVQVLILNPKGKAFKNSSFNYSLSRNGNLLRFGELKTDRNGRAALTFNIPKEEGLSIIAVQVSAEYKGNFHTNSMVIPTTQSQVLLSFFPEGGRFVEGLETKIVFTARNVFGEPIEVEGLLIDDDDRQVGTIKTDLPGLGSFSLIPDVGNPVVVRLTEPSKVDYDFELPEIHDEGIQLKLEYRGSEELILSVNSSINHESLPLIAIAEINGKIVWTNSFSLVDSEQIHIPIYQLPDGILRVNLLNEEFALIAQRPFFICNDTSAVQAEFRISEGAFEEDGEIKISLNSSAIKTGQANLSISLVDKNLCPEWTKNPDIVSCFLLGSSAENLSSPKAYYIDSERFDLFMVSQFDMRYNWKNISLANFHISELSPSQLLQTILEKEKTSNIEQFLSILRTDQFNEKYILNAGSDFDHFMASNRLGLQKLELIPRPISQDEKIARQLERGTSVLNVVRLIKPINIKGQLIYFRGVSSFLYQPSALIVVDGVPRGSGANILTEMDPLSVQSIKVSTTVSDILKYTAVDNASGIIAITTKTAGSARKTKKEASEEIYNPTLLWNPNVQINPGSEISIPLPRPRLKSKYRLVIQGIDEFGRPLARVRYCI
ncbi:MAG: MG2 domain-containing protein [Bacteroidota bacterium]|nr:MG2 domain-containing protein [Bacteroidota bacterium]